MATVETIVDRALRMAGIPIDGVSFGNLNDRRTWRVSFAKGVTKQQEAAAASILASVATDQAALAAADTLDAQRDVDAFPPATLALVRALVDQVNEIRAALSRPLPPIEAGQVLAAVKLKAGTLGG